MLTSVFGLVESALKLAELRTSVLANNISNSSTPHFRARDIDFHKILANANSNLQSTGTTGSLDSPKLLYRVPMQQSLDGNTVDDNLERKNFIENAVRYQVSLAFMQSRSEELRKAFRGD